MRRWCLGARSVVCSKYQSNCPAAFIISFFIMQTMQLDPNTNSFCSYSPQKQSKQDDSCVPECRICLQEMLEQAQLQYCHCRGNLRHVHQECLVEWTSRTRLYDEGKNKFCICQICKARIMLQTQNKLGFARPQEICNSIFCNTNLEVRVKRILFVLLLLLLLATEVALVLIFELQPGERGTTLLLALTVINSCFLLAGTVYLLFKFLLVKQNRVVGIKGISTVWESSEVLIPNQH